MKYRPDIDGLRAIAIVPVVLFHAFPLAFQGGFIGVDIFFVISGYLITQIITEELKGNRFSLLRFYARRINRIFPALILSFATIGLLGWTFLFPHEFVQLGRHILASAGFFENFLLLREVSYFDKAAETKPLLHIWSLAVEEQYYLVWPVLLMVAKAIRINPLWLATIIGLFSFLLNIFVTASGAEKAFFLPWTRAWEFMPGAVIALASNTLMAKHDPTRHALSAAGLFLLASGFLLINNTLAFPGFWALFPTMGATLLIASSSGSWINTQLLARSSMVFIGRISYPLYLWHWPVFSFLYILEGKDSAIELRIAAVGASLVLAVATTFWLERPLRSVPVKPGITVGLIAVFLTLVASGFAIKRGVITPRMNSEETYRIARAAEDFDFPKGLKISPYAPQGVFESYGHSGKSTLILGDSHAMQYSSRIVSTTHLAPAANNRAIFATYSSCPPIPNVFPGWNERGDSPLWASSKACEEIKNFAYGLIFAGKVDVLVISAIWNSYFSGIDGTASGLQGYFVLRNDKRFPLEKSEGAAAALNNLEDFLNLIPQETKVVIVLDNPGGQDFDPTSEVRNLRKPWSTHSQATQSCEVDPRTREIAARMREIALRSKATVFDPSVFYCLNGACETHDNLGRPIYRDINHLTSTFIREKMAPIDQWISPDQTSDR